MPRKTAVVEKEVEEVEDEELDLEGEELELEEPGVDIEAPEGDYAGLYDPDELEDEDDEIDEELFPLIYTITTQFSPQTLSQGASKVFDRTVGQIIKAGDYRVVSSQLYPVGSGDSIGYLYWVTLARDY